MSVRRLRKGAGSLTSPLARGTPPPPSASRRVIRDGNHYEGEVAMAAGRHPNLAWLGRGQSLFEHVYRLMTHEPKSDFSGLIRFLDILKNTPLEQLREQLETICDVRDWVYGMALNNLMVNLDSYIGVGAEYYLYQRAAGFKTMIDSITFGPQELDVSTGRSPDGGPGA